MTQAETKWTKGPWILVRRKRGVEPLVATGSGLMAIDCHQSGETREGDIANATLTTAAPDMAEALGPFARVADMYAEADDDERSIFMDGHFLKLGQCRQARTALRKARGES